MDIAVRVLRRHGGYYKVALIPRRDSTLPEELTVEASFGPVSLTALQDDWYEEVELPNLGELLTRGIRWTASTLTGTHWSLGGRDVFVLAPHSRLSGLVSTTRLVLGDAQFVLCRRGVADQVRHKLALAGSLAAQEVEDGLGIPIGWTAFENVKPTRPVQPSGDGGILDVLCPLPDIEIAMSGGIRLERSTWLAGFPPRIQVLGDVPSAGEVMIDGKKALVDAVSDAYLVDGWDSLGDHQVFCGGQSQTYSIEAGRTEWDLWEAHRWSLGDLVSADAIAQPAVCGALVMRPADSGRAQSGNQHGVMIPSTNPVLLGSQPGQIWVAPTRRDVRLASILAFPPFEPVWALPLDPFRADKRLIGVVPVGPLFSPGAGRGENVATWCRIISDASRKGLTTVPKSDRASAVWNLYRKVARALRRRQ